MAGLKAGTAFVDLAMGEVAGLHSAAKSEGEKAGKEGGEGFKGKFLESAREIAGPLIGIMSVGAVVDFFKEGIKGAEQAAKYTALTEQVIRSTGGAANVTAGQIEEMTRSMMLKNGVDDTTIRQGANLLLTFTNIKNVVGEGGDVFDRATQAAVDMSAALGQDMKSSAMQLGKALQDPIKGATALRRVGVALTAQQQESIKTFVAHGQMAKAQGVILDELGKEFGGAAAAMATPSERMKLAIDDLGKTMGKALLPVIETVSNTIMKGVGVIGAWWDSHEKLRAQIAGVLSNSLHVIGEILTNIVWPAIQRVIRAVVPLAENLGELAKKYIAPLIPILVSSLKPAFEFVVGAIVKVIDIVKSISQFLKDHQEVVKVLAAVILGAMIPSLVTMAATWAAGAVSAMASAVIMAAAWLIGLGPIAWVTAAVIGLAALIVMNWDTIKHAFEVVWNWCWNNVIKPVWQYIHEYIQVRVDAIKSILNWFGSLGGMFERWLAGVELAVGNGAKNIVRFFENLPGNIVRALGNLGATMLKFGGDMIAGFWQGISNAATWLGQKLNAFFLGLIPGFIKDALGIHSPSAVMADIAQWVPKGFAKGMDDNASAVSDAAKRMASRATPSLGNQTASSLGTGANPVLVGAALAGTKPSVAGSTYNVYSQSTDPMSVALTVDRLQQMKNRAT